MFLQIVVVKLVLFKIDKNNKSLTTNIYDINLDSKLYISDCFTLDTPCLQNMMIIFYYHYNFVNDSSFDNQSIRHILLLLME